VSGIGRLLRTVGPLKPSQWFWRAAYVVLRRLEERGLSPTLPSRRAQRDARLAPARAKEHWSEKGRTAAAGVSAYRELESGGITVLNSFKPFRGGADWRVEGQPAEGRLWAFTLQYHEWILDLACAHVETGDPRYAEAVRYWISDWIEACPPGTRGFANFPWNSYAIATRLSTWGRMTALLPAEFWDHDTAFTGRMARSAAMQASYLETHLEWDLRANHLIRDAVGLAWASRLLESPHSGRWMEKAARLAESQVQEQILPDGGHFELSPVYHLQVVDDLLTLLRLGADASGSVRQVLPHMLEFAAWARWPDGSPLLLNDSTEAGAKGLSELATSAAELGIEADTRIRRGTKVFPNFGLIVHNGPRWSAYFDVGPVGPGVQPGHAHADSLSLLVAFDQIPLFIDPGVFAYDRSADRSYSRSTSAHNTVCINEADSSEVWDIFRVGRRAVPTGVSLDHRPEGLIASASHTGYDHHRGKPRHTRTVDLSETLLVEDRVESAAPFIASGGWLLAPGWTAATEESGWLLLHRSGKVVRVELSGEPLPEQMISTRPYYPNFGERIEVERLKWVASSSGAAWVRVHLITLR
jgi:uncharacterized heparinase superfamily protein